MSNHGNSAGHESADAGRQIDLAKTGWDRSESKQACNSVRFWAERLETSEREEDSRYYLCQLEAAARWLAAQVKVDQRQRRGEEANGAAAKPAHAKGQSKADVTRHMQPCDCQHCIVNDGDE